VAVAESGADPLPDGIVAATIGLGSAQAALDTWVRSRRFAPGEFKRDATRPRITLAYQPYWAFDTDTMTSYQGERGETVTVAGDVPPSPGSSAQQAPAPRTTIRWHPVGGTVRRSFANVGATAGGVVLKEAVWDFSAAERYSDSYLVGATAVGATIPLSKGWEAAIATMNEVIEADIRARISGTHQRIGSVHTAYRGAQYRYLLAPAWAGSYHWRGSDYAIDINAETGGVTGQRPWSRVKIALAIAPVAAVTSLIAVLLFLYS
jgi:hypothetical protein